MREDRLWCIHVRGGKENTRLKTGQNFEVLGKWSS